MSGGQPPWARPWQQNNVAAGQAFAYMYDQQAYSSGYFATMQYPNQQAYAQQPNQWPPAPGAMQTGLSPAQRARPLASQAMMREETKTAPVSQSPARSTAATAAGSAISTASAASRMEQQRQLLEAQALKQRCLKLVSSGKWRALAANLRDRIDARHVVRDAESAEVSGFSWMPSIERFVPRRAGDLSPQPMSDKSYNETLRSDSNFGNFRSIEIMSEYYGVPASASLLPDFVIDGADTYSSLRKQQNLAWSQNSVRRGIAYAKDNNYHLAMKCYEEALEVCDSNADAHVAMGAAYANHDKLDPAVRQFALALKLDGTHANARKYLRATKLKMHERGMVVPDLGLPEDDRDRSSRQPPPPPSSASKGSKADIGEYKWLKEVLKVDKKRDSLGAAKITPPPKEHRKEKRKRSEKKEKKKEEKKERKKSDKDKRRKEREARRERKRARREAQDRDSAKGSSKKSSRANSDSSSSSSDSNDDTEQPAADTEPNPAAAVGAALQIRVTADGREREVVDGTAPSLRPVDAAVKKKEGGGGSLKGGSMTAAERRLAVEAAGKAGFCSDRESCVDAELLAWAKAQGSNLAPPLGKIARLLLVGTASCGNGAAPVDGGGSDDEQPTENLTMAERLRRHAVARTHGWAS